MNDLERADEAAADLGRLYLRLGVPSVIIHPNADNERMTLICPKIESLEVAKMLCRAMLALFIANQGGMTRH